MARHKRESNVSLDPRNHWATEAAIQDDLAVEVNFLYASINVSTLEGMKGGSRLSMFILAEANRAASGHDRLAYLNDAALGRIVDAQCAKDEEVLDDPDGFEAKKRKQESLARSGERLVALISLSSSLAIHRPIQEKAGQEQYIKIIKPYFIDDRAWKRARSRLNSGLRKRGIKRDFAVGNGKPPLEGRFKDSGNLEGRPPKQGGWAAIKASRDSPLKAKTRSGDEVTLNRRQHKVTTIFRGAMEGDALARRELMMLIEYLHERKLLVEPPRKRRARKLKLNESQIEIFNKAIACAFEWSLKHFREQYGRVYGGVVDYDARIGLSDEDKALMEEIDKRAEAERHLPSAKNVATGLHGSDGPPSKSDTAYPTLPRIHLRKDRNSHLAPAKREARASSGAKSQTAQGDAQEPPVRNGTLFPPYPTKPRSRATPPSREPQKVPKTKPT